MNARGTEELIEETLDRLKRQDANRRGMELIDVQISFRRIRKIWVWASAAWAIDEQGAVYYRHLIDDEHTWYPIPPDELTDDTYEHMRTGLKIAGEPLITRHSG